MRIFKPHGYQQRGLDFLNKTPKAALFIDMGLGKTGMSLSYIKGLKSSKAVLIVAPLVVAHGTWQQEIAKWDNFKHLSSTILHGKNKVKNYKKDFDIYIINYDGLAWLHDEITKTKTLKFDTIICDESSKLKSHKSKRTKIAQKIANSVERVVLLSASPAPNGHLDLFSQYRLLDKGLRLGSTITGYRKKYFNEIGWQFKKYELKEKAKEQIVSKVSDITFRIDNTELPNVPHLEQNIVRFALSAPVRKQYDLLEKEMFLQLEDLDDGIEVFNAAALTSKCRQFTQGFLYYKNEETLEREVVKIHREKLEWLKEIVDAMQSEPIIIAYNFQYELEMIKNEFGENLFVIGSGSKAEDIRRIERLWNERNIPILVCNCLSVSHGLNLQKGGHNIVWFSLTYSYEHYSQLIGRLHRQGQKNKVHNHILIAENTIDELVLAKLNAKKDGQQAFLDALYKYQHRKAKL